MRGSSEVRSSREAMAVEWGEVCKARNAALSREVERIKTEAWTRRQALQEEYSRIGSENMRFGPTERSSAPERDTRTPKLGQRSSLTGEARPRRETWSGRAKAWFAPSGSVQSSMSGSSISSFHSSGSSIPSARTSAGSLEATLTRRASDHVPRPATKQLQRSSHSVESLGARVEALRAFLKEKLGRMQFQKVYQRLKAPSALDGLDDDNAQRKLTEIERLVQQLILTELHWEEQRAAKEAEEADRRQRGAQAAKDAVDVEVMRKNRPFSGEVMYFRS